jgi:hypothetical protein
MHKTDCVQVCVYVRARVNARVCTLCERVYVCTWHVSMCLCLCVHRCIVCTHVHACIPCVCERMHSELRACVRVHCTHMCIVCACVRVCTHAR